MKSTKKINQEGLVSIITTIIIIIIITIITLSVASSSRNELRQALDEQLSSQALYAAESGVNDVIKSLKDPDPAKRLTSISSCSESEAKLTNNLLGENVKYTCVLVNESPGEINTDINTGDIKAYKLYTGSASASYNSLTIKWSGKNNEVSGSCSTDGTCLSKTTDWGNKIGLLRVRLFDANYNKAVDLVAYPGSLSGGSNRDSIANGDTNLLYGACNGSSCEVKITGLTASTYNILMYSYYSAVNVTVTGRDASGNQLTFVGAQRVIDATGAAGDVLRRIRVAIPTESNISSFPTHVLSSGDNLCKRFTVNATEAKDSSDSSSCPSFP